MESTQAIKALSALAQETRLAAFRMLVEAGPAGLAAGLISERLSLAPATASFHLAQLAHAGLVRTRSEGRYVIYSVDPARMSDLLAYLTQNCCGGVACDITPTALSIAEPA